MTFINRNALTLMAYASFVLLVWLYLRSWWTLPSDVYVIQCKVEDFHDGLLREKQPVVVEDRVLRPLELCRVALRHHYLFDRTGKTVPFERRSTAALVTLFRAHEPAVLRAVSDHHSLADIRFRLDGGEVLMLPAHWHVVSDVACDVVEAFDVSHTFFKPVRLLCDRVKTSAAAAKGGEGEEVSESE